MTHTEECIHNHQIWQDEFDVYVKQWPSYCKTCSGWGGKVSYYDPSPKGVSLSSGQMQEFDTCPDCIEVGLCPRCKCHFDLDDEKEIEDYECTHCGFIFGESNGIFEHPGCFCEMSSDADLSIFDEE